MTVSCLEQMDKKTHLGFCPLQFVLEKHKDPVGCSLAMVSNRAAVMASPPVGAAGWDRSPFSSVGAAV